MPPLPNCADFANQVARYLPVMTDLSPKHHDKFRAYRAKKKAAGLRETRIWVPDVRTKEFWEQSVRCAEALKNAPEEAETTRFIEAPIADDPDFWD